MTTTGSERYRRPLVFGIALLLGVLVASLGLEVGLEARDLKRYPPPGRLIDVGGRRLHLHCSGTGTPTVVMEMGAGAWSVHWTQIRERLAASTRVCVYDRAGLGWSDPARDPVSSARLVDDLYMLLHHSRESGPFVLVGHSLGGWIVRLYQARFPWDVAGIALVESAHPRQWEELPPEVWEFVESSARGLRFIAGLGHFGALRILGDRLATEPLPETVLPAYRVAAVRPSMYSTMAATIAATPAIGADVAELRDLGRLPLMVVSAGRSFDAFREADADLPFDRANEVWARLQDDLSKLSTRSTHLISPAATHSIQLDDPELVTRALAALVDTVRSGQFDEVATADTVAAETRETSTGVSRFTMEGSPALPAAENPSSGREQF